MKTTESRTLILAGSGYELTVAPEAEAQKALLLKHAALIVQVNDPQDNDAARQQVKALAAMRNAVESSRKTVKQPVLDVGREIDAKAKDFVAELDAEEKRLGKLMADYAEEVERLRRKMMQEIEEKRRAQEKARMEEVAAAKAAEEARIAAEKAMWEDDSAADTKAKEAEEKNRLAAEVAEKISDIVKVVAIVPAKAEGVKFTLDYELVDIHALYRFNSSFVKMEPNRAAILAWLKANESDSYPGPLAIGIQVISKAVISTR